jgi:hypothetical protein
MRIQNIGSDAEFVRSFSVDNLITRIGLPNSRRQAGLIVNYAMSDVWIEFNSYPSRLISNPRMALLVPKRGGNLDIPADYVGAIWARWKTPSVQGNLNIHHYYSAQK